MSTFIFRTSSWGLLLLLVPLSVRAQSAFIPASKHKSEALAKVFDRGKADAASDIRLGKLIIKRYGLPSFNGWEDLQAGILYESWGIIVEPVAGDVLAAHEAAYWNGYNSVSIPEIKARFGPRMLDSTQAVAMESAQTNGKRRYRLPPDQDIGQFKIVESDSTPFPDNIAGSGLYGGFSVDFTVSSSGQISDLSVTSLKVYRDAFTKPLFWGWALRDQLPANPLVSKIREWAFRRATQMKVIVNRNHPYWFLEDSLRAGHRFDINAALNPDDMLGMEPPSIDPPDSVLPAKSTLNIFVSVWVDRAGNPVAHKISSIFLNEQIGPDDDPEIRMRSFSNGSSEDTTQAPSDDIALFNTCRMWTEDYLAATSFIVDPEHPYFRYHQVVRTMLPIQKMKGSTNKVYVRD